MKLNTNKIVVACALALATPVALAQTIAASNTNATINTTGHISSVTIDRTGQTVNGFLFELQYNTAHLSLGAQHTDPNVAHPRVTTVGTGAGDFGCVENVVGTLRCLTSNSVTSATYVVNVSFDVLGVATVSPLTFVPANTNFVNAAFADTPFTTVTNGSVTITAAPPATLVFAPPGGTVVQGTNITLTASNGGSANYNCSLPAGVTLANNAGTVTSGNQVTLTPTCAAGNPDGPMACTHTGGAGSTASPVNYTIDCPAAPAPIMSSVAPTALSCGGAPAAVVPVQATIRNSGNANMVGSNCALSGVVGGTMVVATQPASPIAPNATSTATVNCTVPATGSATGTLTCTAPGASGSAVFNLTSTAPPPVPLPSVIPTNSLWSKLGLVGLLAVLGLIAVGFRRQH